MRGEHLRPRLRHAIISDVEVEGRPSGRHSSWRGTIGPPRSDTLLRPSCSRWVTALRLRGSTAYVCLGVVWAAEAELPHLPATARRRVAQQPEVRFSVTLFYTGVF
jgi:hypothetical protein